MTPGIRPLGPGPLGQRRGAALRDHPGLDCITRDGLLLDFATAMTTARVRVKELSGRTCPRPGVFTIRFEVKNVSELNAIRNRLLSIPDVVGARRGSIKISRKIYKKSYQEDKNMLKLYTRKLKKAWEDTATPITVNKREMIFWNSPCAP